MSTDNIQIVIAVDFGTSRSGFAYAYTSKQNEIHKFINWPEQEVPYVKTLTQLLYDSEGNFLAWGYPARRQFAEQCNLLKKEQKKRILGGTPEQHEQHKATIAKKYPTKVQNFKMLLKPDSQTGHAEFVDHAGRIFSAKRLIIDYLRELRKFIFELLSRKTTTLTEENYKWCLTIPAIWEEADKRLMREAAVEAGFVDNISSERLVLVLEPEAAAISFLESKTEKLSRNSRFMIVDAGGGTVDLTVHEIDGDSLKEVVRGSGGACGSTYLDKRFIHYIKELLGEELYQEISLQEPKGMLDLMNAWERAKCDVKASLKKTAYVPMPTPIWRFLNKKNDVLSHIAELQDGEEEVIVLTPEKLNFIYDPVLQDVEDAIKEQIKILDESKDPRCERLVLVGGFAESPILQQRIKEKFSTRFQGIYVLPSPGKAVVEGAVHFALKDRITSRKTRYTYGCNVLMKFREGIDPESKRRYNKRINQTRCKDRFDSFIKIGEEVHFDSKVKKIYYTIEPFQASVGFHFYQTEKPNPDYVDEPKIKEIGFMKIEFPTPSKEIREISLLVYFGQTEIKVEARDILSGKEAKAFLKFD